MRYLRKKFKDMKIRYKILSTFILIGVIPMFILGFFSYAEVRKLLIRQEQSNMSDYLNQAIMSADNQIQIYNNLSEYISYNDTIAKILSYEYDNYYEMYEQYTKVLETVRPLTPAQIPYQTPILWQYVSSLPALHHALYHHPVL